MLPQHREMLHVRTIPTVGHTCIFSEPQTGVSVASITALTLDVIFLSEVSNITDWIVVKGSEF